MSWKWNQWFICIVSVLQEALQTSERKRVAEQTKFTPLWKLRQGPPKDWHLPLNHGKPEDSWTAIINLLWPKQSEMKTLIFLSLMDLVKLFRATCWRDCSSFISIPIFFFYSVSCYMKTHGSSIQWSIMRMTACFQPLNYNICSLQRKCCFLPTEAQWQMPCLA